jgi:hypothetical protein
MLLGRKSIGEFRLPKLKRIGRRMFEGVEISIEGARSRVSGAETLDFVSITV